MTAEPPNQAEPLDWTADGLPRSRRFGDVYFSSEDGLAETRAVFLEGCGLPRAWSGRRRFVVGELGFGTGLNVAALLDLWRTTRSAEARLHIFSVEAFPVTAEDAARALGRWPELAAVTSALVAGWPGRAHGLHRVELPQWGAILDVAVMDVEAALRAWRGAADAWFLDGFAPAANPRMWTDDVLQLVAARSAPGARAATFTVAGQVRRTLAGAGFAVEKRPGFGRKRERLEARLPGTAPDRPAGRVAIIGGGVAGASAARAVRALGGEAVLVEARKLGAGGSGNPAALVTPRLDAGLAAPAQLFARAFARAVRLYGEMPQAVVARGVLQLAVAARDVARFEKIAASQLFEPGSLELLNPQAAADRLGEPSPAALDQREALVIAPEDVLQPWAGEAMIAEVAAIAREGEDWRLLHAGGGEIARAPVVVVAAAHASTALVPGLPLQPVRGQASFASGHTSRAAAWGGYVLPTPDGLLFGATHDRGEAATEMRTQDHARNLEILARGLPQLAKRLANVALEGRASVRAVTPDRLPLAGPSAADGLFVLTGFGSRGFAFAPLLAEHVAALAMGAPSPLAADAATLVEPGRFTARIRS